MGIDLQAIKTIADQGSEYQITGQHITFEGVCPECAKRKPLIHNPCREGLLHGRGYISYICLIFIKFGNGCKRNRIDIRIKNFRIINSSLYNLKI